MTDYGLYLCPRFHSIHGVVMVSVPQCLLALSIRFFELNPFLNRDSLSFGVVSIYGSGQSLHSLLRFMCVLGSCTTHLALYVCKTLTVSG